MGLVEDWDWLVVELRKQPSGDHCDQPGKADTRASVGRGTAGNGAAERRPTDPRRRCPLPARPRLLAWDCS